MRLIQASRIWEGHPAADGGSWPRLALLASLAGIFMASAWTTAGWSLAMAGMGGIPMPGGWMMSMMWLPICGWSWPGLAASFLAMWSIMMAAMMLPGLTPVLWRHHEALIRMRRPHPGRLVASIGLGYLLVWAVIGCVVFVSSAAFASMAVKLPALAHATPLLAGLVLALAGAWQLSPWKTRRLRCWRRWPKIKFAGRRPMLAALREGLRLGAHCAINCAGLTAVLLATGIMDLHIMAAVTVATLVERLAPDGVLAARLIGTAIIGSALVLVAHATGLA